MPESGSTYLNLQPAGTAPKPRSGPGKALGAVIGLIMVAVAAAAFWFWHQQARPVFDAHLDGQRGELVAATDAQVVEVNTALDQQVHRGQPLIRLAPLAGNGAENAPGAGANLDALQGALDVLHAQVLAGEQAEKSVHQEVEQAALRHAQALLAVRGVAQPQAGNTAAVAEFERRKADERTARALVDEAKKKFDVTSSARQTAQATYQRARQALQQRLNGAENGDDAQHLVGHALLAAPVDGRVTSLHVAVGQTVRRGQVLGVVDAIVPEQMWISGRVRASALTRLQPGQRFQVRLPGAPDVGLTAQLESVTPSAQAEDDKDGVPVRLKLVDYDPLRMPALKIGEPVEVLPAAG